MKREDIDPLEIHAVFVEGDDMPGMWLKTQVQMSFRDPRPVIATLQEMIMGAAKSHNVLKHNWNVATEEQWGKLMLRMLAGDKQVKRIA